MRLLADLEALIMQSRRVSIMNRASVDAEQAMELIDQLRGQIPLEIEQARRVVQDRQQIILDAQQEAEDILRRARSRAEYLVGEVGVAAEARQRSEDRLRQAEEQSRRTVEGIERYALTIFEDIEQVMRKSLREIEEAKKVIQEDKTGRTEPQRPSWRR